MTHSVCSNITVIDGAIVNLFVIIPSQYENAKKRYHFRDNEYETADINVSPRRHMTCVEFILHKCDKMGFSSVKRMSKTKVSANVRYEIQKGSNNEKRSILMRKTTR